MTTILHYTALINTTVMAVLLAITFVLTACFTARRRPQRSGATTNRTRRPIR